MNSDRRTHQNVGRDCLSGQDRRGAGVKWRGYWEGEAGLHVRRTAQISCGLGRQREGKPGAIRRSPRPGWASG